MTTELAIGSVLLLGMAHALEPGHGKTMLASYVVGERLQWKNIFSISFGMILSHFVLLTILALLIQQVIGQIHSADFERALKIGAPLLIMGFGTFLYLRERKNEQKHEAECGCGHHLGHDKKAEKPFVAGVLSGMMPCASAFYPLMAAGLRPSYSDAINFIGVYVVGMGIVITSLVATFYFTKRFAFQRLDNLSERFNIRKVSALIIICVGLVYFGMHVSGIELFHMHDHSHHGHHH